MRRAPMRPNSPRDSAVGVVMLRDLTVGVVGPDLLWRAAYLAALGLVGLYASGRRIGKLPLV